MCVSPLKVFLIEPPMPPYTPFKVEPPLGLGYLAAVLMDAGFKVNLLDVPAEAISLLKVKERIKEFDPDMVGISCLSSSVYQSVLSIASIAKKINPQIKVCVGGAHPSALPYECLDEEVIDFVVLGEGEETFSELCRHLEIGGHDFSKIEGLAYKREGRINVNEKRPPIRDLDKLPFPARDLFPMEKYLTTFFPFGIRKHRFGNIITSRGCPYDCLFCSIHSVWGRLWRSRSPDDVVDELEILVERYKVKEVFIEDDNMTLNYKRAVKICRTIVDRGIDVKWRCRNGIHINTLDKSLLKEMAEAGCYAIAFGIESGDERVLHNIIGKKISLRRVRKVIRWAKEVGIKTEGFFILGHPGENFDTFRRTVEFAKQLPLDTADFFVATPLPGSRLYQLCLQRGYIPEHIDWSDFTVATASITTETFSPEDVENWVKKAKREFYARPRYLLSHLDVIPYTLANPSRLLRIM